MPIKTQEVILVVALVLGVIGNYEVWFRSGTIPLFVIVVLSVLFMGGYGGLRVIAFQNAPAFNLPAGWRLICILLMIGMAYGDWVVTGSTNWNILGAILAGCGVDIFSLIVNTAQGTLQP